MVWGAVPLSLWCALLSGQRCSRPGVAPLFHVLNLHWEKQHNYLFFAISASPCFWGAVQTLPRPSGEKLGEVSWLLLSLWPEQ